MQQNDGFEDWIAGSAFIGEDGRAVAWHHGTEADAFNIFGFADEGSIGFHFGSERTARQRLEDIQAGEDARLVSVFCRATKPLRLQDHLTWTLKSVVGELEDLGILQGDEGDEIIDEGDDALLFACIERAGYDCVVYDNATEKHGDSLLIWRQELIKSVSTTAFDKDDPRIDPSQETDEGDWHLHGSWKQSLDAARERLDAVLRTMEMFG